MDFFDGFDTSITGQLEALAFKHFGADYGKHSSIWDNDEELMEEYFGPLVFEDGMDFKSI